MKHPTEAPGEHVGKLAELIRAGAALGGTDFRGANLTGANLRGVFLEDADLRGADLRGADLGGGGYLWGAVHGAHTRWPDGFDVSREVTVL